MAMKVRTPEEIAAAKEHAREKARLWRAANREKSLAIQRRYRDANPEKMRQKGRDWHAANREVSRERARLWREANPEKARGHGRKRKLRIYGISSADYARMMLEQDNRCAICTNLFISTQHTQIDHCHLTSQVRALLCPHCNRGLGHFRDDPLLLQRAIDYLKRFQPK